MSLDLDVRRFADPAKWDHLVEQQPSVWWELSGPMGGLQLINEVRLPYMEEAVGGFAGKRILDIGCGGGLFAEPLARAGADVVGIDPSARSIDAARAHAASQGLEIDYRNAFAETSQSDRIHRGRTAPARWISAACSWRRHARRDSHSRSQALFVQYSGRQIAERLAAGSGRAPQQVVGIAGRRSLLTPGEHGRTRV